jgi:hypothetical protein
MESVEFAKVIKRIMDRESIDLKTLAKIAKADRSYISKVINSKVPLSVGPTVSGKIARAFPAYWPKNNTNNTDPERFTADQLFHMYMKAMERQDGLMNAQTTILKSIEDKMAKETTLAALEANYLKRTLAAALVVAKGQEDGMKELRGLLLQSPVRQKVPSRGGGKERDRIDGGLEKKGKTPA